MIQVRRNGLYPPTGTTAKKHTAGRSVPALTGTPVRCNQGYEDIGWSIYGSSARVEVFCSCPRAI